MFYINILDKIANLNYFILKLLIFLDSVEIIFEFLFLNVFV